MESYFYLGYSFHMDSSIITVITVVRNDLSGLKKSLASFQSQQGEFEVVVVDGESSDGTLEFLKLYSPEFKLHFIQKPPNGIYDAMNAGAKLATGSWLWFINAGDTFISKLSILNASKEIGSLNISSIGMVASPVLHLSALGYFYDLSIPRIDKNQDQPQAVFNHQGVLTRKDLFFNVGGFDPTMKLAGDSKFLDSAITVSEVRFSKHIYVAFAMGGASTANFGTTLAELNEIRYDVDKYGSRLSLIFKTKLRRLLLGLELSKFSFLVTPYLRLRQKRILTRINGFYSDAIEILSE
jgi:glycosyltransferase involved in cell wall biosynthesis